MAGPALSVIVPCFERAATLARVLEAYEAQEGAFDFEVVAVDDGSTDATPEVLARHRPRRFRLRAARQANAGPGSARNRALDMAGGRLALFTGDDVIPEPDFLLRHVEAHRGFGDPRVAILGRTDARGVPETTVMRHIYGLGAQQFSYFYLAPGSFVDFRHFYTSNISLRRELLEDRGRFSTLFPFAAWEDVELGWRLERRGMRIFYEAGALAHHEHAYSARSFARRQERSGRMAALVLELRPELGPWTGVRDLSPRHRRERRRAAGLGVTLRATPTETEEALLRLLTPYEHLTVGSLDALYLAAFRYFQLKGLAHGMGGEERALPVRAEMLAGEVLPAVRAFVEGCDREGVPVPEGEREFFAREAARLGAYGTIVKLVTPGPPGCSTRP